MGPRDRNRRLIVAAFAVLALVSVGCSTKEKAESTTTSTAAAEPSSTTTESSTSAPAAGGSNPWREDAQAFRGQDGTEHKMTCPPGGQADSVWGAGIYTDDSSVCTAAVQSGLITFEEGGEVTFLIGPGKDSYEAGSANGVVSESYGRWDGSFTFPDAPPGSVDFAVSPKSWNLTLADKRGSNGTRVTVKCSANGRPGSVWGSSPYTDDSSVCTAAVHAGLITLEKGGTVVAEIAPGENSYKGTTANGVKSSDYGAFDGSFTFPSDQKTG